MVPPPVEQPPAEEQGLDPNVCAECGGEPQAGFQVPLCAPCRKRLAHRPIPAWILGTGAFVAVMIVVSLASFPKTIRLGVAYERAQKLDAAGDAKGAAREYQKVVDSYPEFYEGIARLALAKHKAGDDDGANRELDKIENKELPAELVDEINATTAKSNEVEPK